MLDRLVAFQQHGIRMILPTKYNDKILLRGTVVAYSRRKGAFCANNECSGPIK